MIGKYQNSLYKTKFDRKTNQYKMIAFKEINGFVKGKTLAGNDVWRKFVDKSELQELYDIDFFAEWNGKIFNCGYDGNGIIILRESTDAYYAESHGFEQLDRLFYVKEVPFEECTKLGVIKQDLLQDEYGRVKEERIVSIDEFEKLYTENIIDLFQRNTKNKGERVWEK